MKVQRPAGVAARLQVKGGFNSVTFDDQTVDVMGGKMTFQSPDFDTMPWIGTRSKSTAAPTRSRSSELARHSNP